MILIPKNQRRITMRKVALVVSIFSVLFFVQFVYAQMDMGAGPKFYSDFKPIIGGWSEYQMTEKGGPTSKMKIAIVGKEGDAYWYETVMETKQEGRSISKMLVSGNPDDPKNVKKMIVKMGNEPAMEMPTQMMMQGSDAGGQKGKTLDKGTESIKVPAGTFTARRIQSQHEDMMEDTWVHKDVSPYGVVKSKSKDFEMLLLGYGTGAKTQITEKPQKFEMPQMPQMPSMPPKKK
jgi:hypothetical protein